MPPGLDDGAGLGGRTSAEAAASDDDAFAERDGGGEALAEVVTAGIVDVAGIGLIVADCTFSVGGVEA
jgi:hypothetical protein